MVAGDAEHKGKYCLHRNHDHEPSSEQNGASYQSNNSNTAIPAEEVAEQKHAIAEQKQTPRDNASVIPTGWAELLCEADTQGWQKWRRLTYLESDASNTSNLPGSRNLQTTHPARHVTQRLA